MDDLSSMLSQLLSNPGALDKVKGLAGLLGGGGGAAPEQSPAPLPQAEQNSPLEGLDGDMLQMVMKFAPLLSSFRQEDDSTRLLHALRPLLGEERQKKLDEGTKLLQMMRMLPLLKNSGIL
jgi:hypothetical protein